MRIALEIRGAAELDRKLAALPAKVAQRVIRQAVRNAQKVGLQALRTMTLALPVSHKRAGAIKALIAKAWELRVAPKQQAHSYAMHLRLKSLPEFYHTSKSGKVSFIPAAIEFGHGATPEKAARPYARPAVDMAKPLVEMVLAHELGKGIEKVAQESA